MPKPEYWPFAQNGPFGSSQDNSTYVNSNQDNSTFVYSSQDNSNSALTIQFNKQLIWLQY